MIGPHVAPGVTTDELDRLCYEYIVNVQGTIPANLNYRGFPKTICTSVNHVVCHGIPNEKRLKAGDIVNIDVTVIKDGFHGDTSRMYFVGKPPVHAQRLAEACFEAMWRGIEVVKPGTRLGDIGHAIQTLAEGRGYGVVREFTGHGVGQDLWEEPQVPHFGQAGTGQTLRVGMVIAIEPMITTGDWRAKVDRDGWTARTVDGSLCAQYEHSLAITENGPVILTEL
jgi:methionyl aminopeptidase